MSGWKERQQQQFEDKREKLQELADMVKAYREGKENIETFIQDNGLEEFFGWDWDFYLHEQGRDVMDMAEQWVSSNHTC